MKDILVLGKVKQLEQARAADLIIIDAPAAGHAVSFLMSPIGLLDAVSMGPVRKQALDVVEMLADPQRCQVMLVTIPEETPVNELVDTAYALEDKIGVSLGPVVLNSCYFEADLETSLDDIRRDADLLDVFVSDREARDLVRAAAFRADRHALQQEQAARLAEKLPLPQIRLPFLFTADVGPNELESLADTFATGVERLPEPRP
jgi:anion-transporting  ArsA/GET3 family ATPase